MLLSTPYDEYKPCGGGVPQNVSTSPSPPLLARTCPTILLVSSACRKKTTPEFRIHLLVLQLLTAAAIKHAARAATFTTTISSTTTTVRANKEHSTNDIILTPRAQNTHRTLTTQSAGSPPREQSVHRLHIVRVDPPVVAHHVMSSHRNSCLGTHGTHALAALSWTYHIKRGNEQRMKAITQHE